MKILMAYLNELSGKIGGAEKVLCEFSNAMVDRHHSVAIMYEGKSDKKPYYRLDSAVIRLVMKHNPDAIMFIKSTIPVGYTKEIREEIGLKNIICY